jgi:hypothetical protein
MKFLSMCKSVALTVLLSIAALPAMAQSLTTTYEGGNGQGGVMFDLVPSTNMTIDSFDASIYAGTTAEVTIYWRLGTANGFQNSADGWNVMGTATVASQGDNVPTHIAIGGLALSAGQTYGIYIDTGPSSGVRYTNGRTTYSNADLTLNTWFGKGRPAFTGGTFDPRIFNGTVYYTAGPVTTCASEGYTGTKLEWCKNICERGYTGSTLAMWIRRWTDRYRTLPYCAIEQPQQEG